MSPKYYFEVFRKKKSMKTAEKRGRDPDNLFTYPMEVPTPKGQLLGLSRIVPSWKIDQYFWYFFQNFACSYLSQILVFFCRTWLEVVYLIEVNNVLGGATPWFANRFCGTCIWSMFGGGMLSRGLFFGHSSWPGNDFLDFAPATISRVQLTGESIAIIHLCVRSIFVKIFWNSPFLDKSCLTGLSIALRIETVNL